MAVTVNTTERRVSVSISRGPKGAPFTFEDFTPEQLDDLKLRFSDLTEADKEELKLKFSDLTPEEKEELSLKWEDLTPEQKLELKGEKGDPFTYEDFTQEQKDEVFNTFLSNFYDPSIVALSSRGSNEGATFEVKLNKIQDEMNILDPLPSLLMLPSGVKAGKLYSVLPEDGSGDFTVDRNSTATRVNAEGIIEEVQPNVPRIDYSTGEPMLLVEGGAVNFVQNSDPVNNENSAGNIAYEPFEWGLGLINNSVVYADNLATRFRYAGTTTNEKFTFSFYIIMDDGSIPVIGESSDFRIYLLGQTSNISNVKIEHIKNNIYRIQATSIDPPFYSPTLTGNNGVIKNSSNNPKGFRISGFQIKRGVKTSSYIPTNGAIVTRLADNIFQTSPKTGDAVITFDDGTTQTISGIEGETFTLPEGVIKKVEML